MLVFIDCVAVCFHMKFSTSVSVNRGNGFLFIIFVFHFSSGTLDDLFV